MNAQVPTNQMHDIVEWTSSDDPLLEGLARIAQSVERATTLDQLLHLSLVELTRLCRADRAIALLKDVQGREIWVYEHPQSDGAAELTLDDIPGAAETMRLRRPMIVHPQEPALLARDVRVLLVAPLIARDEALGALAICSAHATRTFDSKDVALIRALSGQIALVIIP